MNSLSPSLSHSVSLFLPLLPLDFMCHDGGATSLGYSRSRQRLICGGKRGEVCIFDIRQYSLLQVRQIHGSSVNCIAVNDIDGYFVTGAADGEIKVSVLH